MLRVVLRVVLLLLLLLVLLVVVVPALLVQALAVRVALRLHTHICTRLLRRRAWRRPGARRAWLEHGGVLDKRLREPVPRTVGRAIVLVLRVRVRVVVRHRRGRVPLLRRLATCRLWLPGTLRVRVLLRGLSTRGRQTRVRRGLLCTW